VEEVLGELFAVGDEPGRLRIQVLRLLVAVRRDVHAMTPAREFRCRSDQLADAVVTMACRSVPERPSAAAPTNVISALSGSASST